jgi:hypothetical protein
MNRRIWLLLVVLFAPMVPAFSQQAPSDYFKFTCVKIQPGKANELERFRETMRRVAQADADTGGISGAYLLHPIFPEGAESRCDYIIINSFSGLPHAPQGNDRLNMLLQKARVPMTAADYVAKRSDLQQVISVELWHAVVFVGNMQKGDYLYLNFMKVHDPLAYTAFEKEVRQPVARFLLEDGTFHAWFAMTVDLPEGTGFPYQFVSADIFPSWEKAIAGADDAGAFKKVHPDMDYSASEAKLAQMRDLDRRYFLVIQDIVLPSANTRP